MCDAAKGNLPLLAYNVFPAQVLRLLYWKAKTQNVTFSLFFFSGANSTFIEYIIHTKKGSHAVHVFRCVF